MTGKTFENAMVWLIATVIISAVGLLYAVFIMLAWNGLAVKLCSSLSEITYWQSYLVYLFFVVLPRIMPIRFTRQQNTGGDGKRQG